MFVQAFERAKELDEAFAETGEVVGPRECEGRHSRKPARKC